MSGYRTTNPATGETLATFPYLADSELEQVTERALAAFAQWRAVPMAERAALLGRVADLYEERRDALAATVTTEMGKPITQAKGEFTTVIGIFRYYAAEGPKLLKDEAIAVVGKGEARVVYAPLGPLLGIMPWNYPHYQVARFIAPNLLLGNPIVLKHAANCPQSALAIEQLLLDAGLPEGVYQNVFATHEQVARLIAHEAIRGVSLTGSERAGAIAAAAAGAAMKKSVLELGGSDPFIVLDDADLPQAAKAAVQGRCMNDGQACTASKRFIAVDAVYDEFLRRFVDGMAAVTPGDPMDLDTYLGPLVSDAAATELDELVADAVAHGATVEVGGREAGAAGAYYPATVLTGVTPEARAYSEELFGPVAVVYRASDEEDAVRLANDSRFGLSSSIFTADLDRAERIAAQLETGMVWFNSISKSSAELPFGGVKQSGTGRELGRFGLTEFANVKLIRRPGE